MVEQKEKKGKKEKGSNLGAIIVLLLLAGLGAYVYLQRHERLKFDWFKTTEVKKPAKVISAEAPAPRYPVKARMAIIIDDLGLSPEAVDRLLALELPFDYSFIPGLRYTEKLAAKVHAAGGEVMVHLPMEPLKPHQIDPAWAVVYVKMSDRDIRRTVKKDMEFVPYAAGLNNHMGSRATVDPRVMNVVLEEVKISKLFFVDSLTNSKSIAYKMAKKMDIPAGRREIFLDDTSSKESPQVWLERAVKIALKNGSVIAIGHPHQSTLAVLAEELPKLAERGVTLVPVSELIRPVDVAAGN